MKVLLVDDEQEMVTTLAERLSLRDIEADWVLSGHEAIKRVRKKKYDILVLDMKMPSMSGLETMNEVRKIQPEAKILFLTGHGSQADCEAGKRGGACFYLMKPIDIKLLIKSMKDALRQ